MSKVLLITGASRGIGAATAKLAGARGYDVAVNYLRDAKAADAVVAAVKGAGQRAVAIQGDMAREADIDRMFATIDKELGRLTHLVYNAGTTGGNSRVEAVDAKTIRDTLELNVVGALLCAKAAILRMSPKHGGQGGAMVMISSMAATLGSPGEYVWYAASKGAVDSMTIGLSKELAARRHPRQRGLAGNHRNRHPSARPARAHRADRPDGARGHRRGSRRNRAVPALRRVVLHHRHERPRRGWAIAAHLDCALRPDAGTYDPAVI